MKLDEAKSTVCSYIDDISNELIAISHAIHENPELGYEEHFAHEQLTQLLIDTVSYTHLRAHETLR